MQLAVTCKLLTAYSYYVPGVPFFGHRLLRCARRQARSHSCTAVVASATGIEVTFYSTIIAALPYVPMIHFVHFLLGSIHTKDSPFTINDPLFITHNSHGFTQTQIVGHYHKFTRAMLISRSRNVYTTFFILFLPFN